MFSDEILEKIFSNERVNQVPIIYQNIMIKAIEEVLEEQKYENDNRHG